MYIINIASDITLDLLLNKKPCYAIGGIVVTVTHSVENRSEINIPLGRRIGEILEEKGSAFSLRAFSQRIGMSKDTLSRIISGERPIKPSELEKISECLKMSIPTIKQHQFLKARDELIELLQEHIDLQKALSIAERIYSIACGVTERYEAAYYMGQIHFELRQYEISHQFRLEAYSYAQKLEEKYGESNKLYRILEKLMTSFTVKKDYSSAYKVVKQVEAVITNNPKGMGSICYTLAMIAYNTGNLEEARDRLYQSLSYYELTGDKKEIGKAQHNCAYIEYQLRDLTKAKTLFEAAIETMKEYRSLKLTPIKDYVKVLIKLGNLAEAEKLIVETLEYIQDHQTHPDLLHKFYLLLAIVKNDPSIAENILSHENVDKRIKLIACRFLMKLYSDAGDSSSLMRYYKSAEEYSVNMYDVLSEGDL